MSEMYRCDICKRAYEGKHYNCLTLGGRLVSYDICPDCHKKIVAVLDNGEDVSFTIVDSSNKLMREYEHLPTEELVRLHRDCPKISAWILKVRCLLDLILKEEN